MTLLTLPAFQVIRHITKGGEKRISVHFPDRETKPCDALLEVLNAKRGGFGSYSRIRAREYGWVFTPGVWNETVNGLGSFDLWEPLREAFQEAIEDWMFEVQAV